MKARGLSGEGRMCLFSLTANFVFVEGMEPTSFHGSRFWTELLRVDCSVCRIYLDYFGIARSVRFFGKKSSDIVCFSAHVDIFIHDKAKQDCGRCWVVDNEMV